LWRLRDRSTRGREELSIAIGGDDQFALAPAGRELDVQPGFNLVQLVEELVVDGIVGGFGPGKSRRAIAEECPEGVEVRGT